ncbi:hypothetical protein APHAL10511_000284 [Amanita phalloides]|nr:hypothetical protein APHAL10511_000284 [Amanita phalloides]
MRSIDSSCVIRFGFLHALTRGILLHSSGTGVHLTSFTIMELEVDHMESEMELADVKLPVVFTYEGGQRTFVTQPHHGGGQGLGVWQDGNQAWKIFPDVGKADKTFKKVTGYYTTAYGAKLPMGGQPFCPRGTVKQGGDKATNGFAVVTGWLEGTEFNFHRIGKKPFKTALTTENVSHSESSQQFKTIMAACEIARDLPLNDVQGKVNGRAGVSEPIAFFDINIGGGGGQGAALVDEMIKWGNQP